MKAQIKPFVFVVKLLVRLFFKERMGRLLKFVAFAPTFHTESWSRYLILSLLY
jgi:hypothetical protein